MLAMYTYYCLLLASRVARSGILVIACRNPQSANSQTRKIRKPSPETVRHFPSTYRARKEGSSIRTHWARTHCRDPAGRIQQEDPCAPATIRSPEVPPSPSAGGSQSAGRPGAAASASAAVATPPPPPHRPQPLQDSEGRHPIHGSPQRHTYDAPPQGRCRDRRAAA